nr:MAG: wsv526-like protein [Marsupenaeus japonicus pemonivirus]
MSTRTIDVAHYENCLGCTREDCISSRLIVTDWDGKPAIHIQRPDPELFSGNVLLPLAEPTLKWGRIGSDSPVYGVPLMDARLEDEDSDSDQCSFDLAPGLPNMVPISVQRVALQRNSVTTCKFVLTERDVKSSLCAVPDGGSFVGPYCSENGSMVPIVNGNDEYLKISDRDEVPIIGMLFDTSDPPEGIWIPVSVESNPPSLTIPGNGHVEVKLIQAPIHGRNDTNDVIDSSGLFSLSLGAAYAPPSLISSDFFLNGTVQLYNLSDDEIKLTFHREGEPENFVGYVRPLPRDFSPIDVQNNPPLIDNIDDIPLHSLYRLKASTSLTVDPKRSAGIPINEDILPTAFPDGRDDEDRKKTIRYARVISSVVHLVPSVSVLRPGARRVFLFNTTSAPITVTEGQTVALAMISEAELLHTVDSTGTPLSETYEKPFVAVRKVDG